MQFKSKLAITIIDNVMNLVTRISITEIAGCVVVYSNA